MIKSLKIPFIFLLTGILWAVFSDPFITFLTPKLQPADQDRYRSLNDFVFVGIVAFILYFLIKKEQHTLARSEEEYRELFESNPNPMWIYDGATLQFIKANDAAVDKYGYTRNEFLKMSVLDIQLKDDRERLGEFLKNNQALVRRPGIRRHVKASGEILNVSVVAYPVLFDNRKCSLAMASDMTELLDKERKLQHAYQKIKASNEVLLQIAWANSHELRKPLCSILSLINLMKYSTEDEERDEFLSLLQICSAELDQVLRQNNEKVTELEMVEV